MIYVTKLIPCSFESLVIDIIYDIYIYIIIIIIII
jgi:hypothetical protein